jgi:hypothetical protein
LHVGDAVRHARGQQRAAQTWSDAAEPVLKAESGCAAGCRAGDQHRRRHGGDRARRSELREHIQIGGAREAVGSERNHSAGTIERLHRRIASADAPVAARATDDHAATLCHDSERRSRELRRVHHEESRPQHAKRIEILDRPHLRRPPRFVPDAKGFQRVRDRTAPCHQEFHFLWRLGEMDRRRQPARGGFACDGAEQVR